MSIFKWLKEALQYLVEGVVRIFRPSDDEYPNIGVQPFGGDSFEDDA
ncbi:MAG TPA: hypothetical protein V6D26_21535 [Stenomitos sp.]